MSSFFDKAKGKAQQIAGQVKDKVEDVQDRRKADDLLDDIGRIVYRQRTTEGAAADDEARLADLVAQLQALEASGTAILDEKGTHDDSSSLPPPSPSDLPPPTV